MVERAKNSPLRYVIVGGFKPGFRKWGQRVAKVLLHRLIVGAKPSERVDHENGFTLDNRRFNLRKADAQQNGANRGINRNNRSGFKGVSWNKNAEKWSAHIKVLYRKKHLGYFTEKVDAAKAYDSAAQKAFGDFCAA